MEPIGIAHARRPRRSTRRPRRGMTMVFVAMCIVVLIGFAGVAVDFARAYSFKARLKTLTDAAALSAIVEVQRGRTGIPAVAQARAMVPLNPIEGTLQAAMVDADVEPGTWDFASGAFVAAAWGPATSAVRVTARYTQDVTLGRVFGVNVFNLRETSVAAIGGVGMTDCLRPFAVSYRAMLDALGYQAQQVSYDLTQADIDRLATGLSVTLLFDAQNPTGNGNIGQVVVNDPWQGNNAYRDAITGCANMYLGPGVWVNADPGAGPGQTNNALRDFCDANGGTTGNNQRWVCTGTPDVKLLIWDINNGQSGGNLQYRVKYIGAFEIRQFDRGNGPNAVDQINGAFSRMYTTGGFIGGAAPMQKGALVQ
jgi:Flp pilus assembly protein TadG